MAQADLIAALVDRFLIWPVPESACADLCATKQQTGRTGTHFFTADEARQMIEYLMGSSVIAAHDAEIAADERAKFRPTLWWRYDDEDGACYGDRDHVLDGDDVDDNDIIEIRRAASLPSEWAVQLVTARDSDGFPMVREIRYFATRDEAVAAIEGSQP